MQRHCSLGILVIVANLVAGCGRSPNSSESSSNTDSTSSSETTAADAGGSDGPAIEVVNQVVETSCGECNFELEGSDCDLAIRIDGKAYFVDGFAIDDFGDAHAGDGLCNSVRQARVTGRIEGGRFIATAFELLPEQ